VVEVVVVGFLSLNSGTKACSLNHKANGQLLMTIVIRYVAVFQWTASLLYCLLLWLE